MLLSGHVVTAFGAFGFKAGNAPFVRRSVPAFRADTIASRTEAAAAAHTSSHAGLILSSSTASFWLSFRRHKNHLPLQLRSRRLAESGLYVFRRIHNARHFTTSRSLSENPHLPAKSMRDASSGVAHILRHCDVRACTPHSSGFRAPCICTFSNSLQSSSISTGS
jgi:hypothetical protein